MSDLDVESTNEIDGRVAPAGRHAERSSAPVLDPSLTLWLREIDGAAPLAVVLGGSCNGLSFVRSLGRRRIPTLLLDSQRSPEMRTRFGKVAVIPSAYGDPEGCISFLEQVGERLSKPGVIFATSDVHTRLVAEYEARLRPGFRFLVPDLQTVDRIINKRKQYEFARSIGIPIPTTSFPESVEQAARAAAEARYPCLLKPYDSHAVRSELSDRKVILVESAPELMAAYVRLTGLGVPLMIQELIPGEESALVGYLAFWDRDRHERAWLTKQKLRQNPPGLGDGTLSVSVDVPEATTLSRRLLDGLEYQGFVGVEFKVDERDRTLRLIEINPRTVSGNELAIRSGVDFPWIGYQALTDPGSASATVVRGRNGVTYVHEQWDARAFMALRRAGRLSFFGWLWSLRRVRATAIGAWDDPMPLLAAIWHPQGSRTRESKRA
ncbi:MAG: ATP-grasp domain-containing protein [Thermoleophilia bacterium]